MRPEQPLKILQLIYKPDHLLPLFNLYAKVLMDNGHHVTTIFLTGSEDQQTIAATLANEVEFCCFSRKQLRTSKYRVSRKIRHIWKKQQFDLAICHRHKPSFVFSLARMGLKHAPMLSVVHALGQYKRKNRRIHARLLYRNHFNKTTLIAVSKAVLTNIEQDFAGKPPCPVTAIPNIIDLETVVSNQLSRNDARHHLGVGSDDFVIGNVARLVADKAQKDLLTALSRLKQTDQQLATTTKLVIIGTGKLEKQLKHHAESLGLTQSVVFAGDIKLASRLMPAFDVFVLASIVEPFGLVLLEAMAARLPIVATRVGSIGGIVNQGAKLVAPANPDQLAQAILSITQLNVEQRREIGNAGYEHLLNSFSTAQFQKQLELAINRLLH